MYELGYYYKKKKLDVLQRINKESNSHDKILVCWVKGDQGITPSLLNFHLYRLGGYKSKNKGNQFSVPVFIKDPLPEFFNDIIPLNKNKPEKPVIGFCGQGKAGVEKVIIDLVRGFKNRLYKYAGKYPFDLEALSSSTYMRSKILDSLEASPLVHTNFIRHRKYRAGTTSETAKKESTKAFFKNMAEVDYIVCYRGAGNFSVRLFEAMASGKIPVIVTSDNNLPFEDRIQWGRFPIIPEKQWKKTDQLVASFHDKLSNEEFVELQMTSRQLWEDYLSYKGFFSHWVDRYISTQSKTNLSVEEMEKDNRK